MATITRIYAVIDGTGKTRLVRATHPSTALQHVARSAFTVRVASQDDLIDCLDKGIKVETIKAEQQEIPQ